MKLANKVALITGAVGGIGLAAAHLFARAGAAVVLVDRDEGALAQALTDIGSDLCSSVTADIAVPEQMENAVRHAVARHGRVDVLVANAGIEGSISSIVDYPVDAFDRVLAVNVKGVFLGLKYVIPVMRENGGGSIVITSSAAGVSGATNMSAYCASKHAVVGLMRTAALECARYKIRVNTVNPGPIETRMMRSIEEGAAPGSGEVFKGKMTNTVPMRRYGLPDEIANMMLFLASDDSSYCTGSVYMVDGGGSA